MHMRFVPISVVFLINPPRTPTEFVTKLHPMKHRWRIPFAAPILVLILAMSDQGQAAEWGRARGTPVLGRVLDLRLPLTLDPTSDDPCAQVQVYFGETSVRGQTEWIAADNSAQGQVRVTTSQLVDEPIVTLYVTAGCLSKVSRKYVFFAEPMGDVVTGSPAPAPVQQVQIPIVAEKFSAASVARGENSRAAAPRVRNSKPSIEAGTRWGAYKLESALVSKEAQTASVKRDAVKRKSSVKARLKIEPLDWLTEPDVSLKYTDILGSLPTGNTTTRAQAAALWRAVNATPEDVLRDGARLQQMETAVDQVQTKLHAQQDLIRKFQEDLDQQRLINWILLGILGCAALGLFVLRKTLQSGSNKRPWWVDFKSADKRDEHETGDEDATSSQMVFEMAGQATPNVANAPDADAKSAPAKAQAPDSQIDYVNSKLAQIEKGFVADSYKPKVLLKKKDFAESTFGGMTAKNTDVQELFDVQEQFDFFVSLGQYDPAIDVLKQHIADNPDSSAIAYLDLFSLFYRLKRRDEYEELIEQFNQHFNAQVPPFEEYASGAARHLEDYPEALSRIQALWPSAKTMDVIAESIFKKPHDDGSEAMSLYAYQELLMLYAILKDINGLADAGFDQFDTGLDFKSVVSLEEKNIQAATFENTKIKPLQTKKEVKGEQDYWASADAFPPLEHSAQSPKVKPDLYTPKPSKKIGLDIDLSQSDDPTKTVKLNKSPKVD
jgi:hypothetical protein